jgi:hypothetical protein
MPARLSAWGRLWQVTATTISGLLVGAIPLALGYLSVTFSLLAVPLMALAYGAGLIIIFIGVGCLMSRERRPVGVGMTAGVVAAIVVYALLVYAAAGSY